MSTEQEAVGRERRLFVGGFSQKVDGWSGPNRQFETESPRGLSLGGTDLVTNVVLLEKGRAEAQCLVNRKRAEGRIQVTKMLLSTRLVASNA